MTQCDMRQNVTWQQKDGIGKYQLELESRLRTANHSD